MSFSPIQHYGPSKLPAAEVEDIKTRLFENWDDKENIAHESRPRLSTKICTDENNSFMKVFLRIRPFTEPEIAGHEAQGVVRVLDNMTVRAQAPQASKAFKSNSSANQIGKFSFTRVFRENTTQRDFFQTTTLPMLQELLSGKNCLMFTTGITNSGKTYTILGTPTEPGILPRTVDVIFNSLSPYLGVLENLRPTRFCEVKRINKTEVAKHAEQKRICLELSFSSDAEHAEMLVSEESDFASSTSGTTTENSDTSMFLTLQYVPLILKETSLDQDDFEFERMVKERVAESTRLSVDSECKYSVFVTYIEVYNERIYDLLEPPPATKDTRRVGKRLRLDKNGNIYVEGLREIQVESVDEAFRIIGVGRRNRRVAANNLNINSSRRLDHIKSIKEIVRFPDVKEPHFAHVSQLSLVDLAGSERNVNTKATGHKLKEAANINKSIMTLGQCIEILRHNQSNKDDRRVPFRDSQLTRLFQAYLLGMGSVRMVVNISACASAYDETIHVLKFSAVARKITHAPITSKIDTGRSALATASMNQAASQTNMRSQQASTNSFGIGPRPSDAAHIQALQKQLDVVRNHSDTLQDQVFELQKQVERMKSEKEHLELKIREEIAAELSDQFVEVEETYEQIFRQQDDMAEEMREKQLAIVTQSVARHAARSRVRQEQKNKSNQQHQDKDDFLRLERALKRAETEVEQTQQALQAKEEAFATSKEELDSVIIKLHERIEELESEKSQLMDTTVPLETFDAETKRMEVEANIYLQRLNEMEARFDELQTSSEETRMTLQETIETQEQHIADLKDQLDKMTERHLEETESLEATISTLRNEIQALRNQGHGPDEHTSQEMERYKMQVAHLKNKKRVLEEKANDLRRELESVKTEHSELKTQLADMVSEQVSQEVQAYLYVISARVSRQTTLASSRPISFASEQSITSQLHPIAMEIHSTNPKDDELDGTLKQREEKRVDECNKDSMKKTNPIIAEPLSSHQREESDGYSNKTQKPCTRRQTKKIQQRLDNQCETSNTHVGEDYVMQKECKESKQHNDNDDICHSEDSSALLQMHNQHNEFALTDERCIDGPSTHGLTGGTKTLIKAAVSNTVETATAKRKSVESTILGRCISSEDSVILTPKRSRKEEESKRTPDNVITFDTFEQEVDAISHQTSSDHQSQFDLTTEYRIYGTAHGEQSILEPLSQKKRQTRRRRLGTKTTTTVSPVTTAPAKTPSAMERLLTPIAKRLRPRRTQKRYAR
eukprot:gene538-7872_t